MRTVTLLWLDKEGNPISDEQAFALRYDPPSAETPGPAISEYARIGFDDVDGAHVFTVWLGLNHAIGPGEPPEIFETMIFHGPYHHSLIRYGTEGDAIDGHAAAVAALRDGQPLDWMDARGEQ